MCTSSKTAKRCYTFEVHYDFTYTILKVWTPNNRPDQLDESEEIGYGGPKFVGYIHDPMLRVAQNDFATLIFLQTANLTPIHVGGGFPDYDPKNMLYDVPIYGSMSFLSANNYSYLTKGEVKRLRCICDGIIASKTDKIRVLQTERARRQEIENRKAEEYRLFMESLKTEKDPDKVEKRLIDRFYDNRCPILSSSIINSCLSVINGEWDLPRK